MKKNIIFPLTVWALLLAGCTQQATTTNQNLNQPSINTDQIVSTINYNFQGCENQKTNLVTLSQTNKNLNFSQILNTYCDAEKDMVISHTISDNTIEIKETFDPKNGVTRCTCPLKIEGSINNLNSGIYEVKFVFDNKYVNQTETIDTQRIEIK